MSSKERQETSSTRPLLPPRRTKKAVVKAKDSNQPVIQDGPSHLRPQQSQQSRQRGPQQESSPPTQPGDIHAIVRAMVSNNPGVLDHVGEQLGLPAEVLQRSLEEVEHGAELPAEVQKKLQGLQRAAQPNGTASDDGDLFAEEREQDVVAMYRSSFLKHADLALGPVVVLICFLLFYLEALHVGMALILCPTVTGLLAWLLHRKILGLPVQVLPASRMLGSMVLSLEAAAWVVFHQSLYPWVRVDLWPWVMLMYGMTAAAMVAHVLTARSQPGYLPKGTPPPPIPLEQLMILQQSNPYNCLDGVLRSLTTTVLWS
jgi:hypothetical protein